MASYISLYYKVGKASVTVTVVFAHFLSKYTIGFHSKVGENLIGSYKYITHETHTIICTNSRKRASGFTPGVF